jgi:c-di-GMP-binding flagellar brake protein YcgR
LIVTIERRRYQRVPCFCPLQLTVLPGGPTVPGNSFDISRGGVGLVANAFLERGQSVFVHFQVHDRQHETVEASVLGRVAYSRADEDGNQIGVEFMEDIRESSQPVLAKLLDNL